jgi:hypothetical protein
LSRARGLPHCRDSLYSPGWSYACACAHRRRRRRLP